MKQLCQILLLLIPVTGIVVVISASFHEVMGFDQAYDRGVLTAYEVSSFFGLGLSLMAVTVSLGGLISGLTRKKPVLYPLLVGVAGLAYALCFFFIPIVQSLNQLAKDESQIMKNNPGIAEQTPSEDRL